VRKYVERVRHNIASHYYQPKALMRGYTTFFEMKATPSNESAYMSIGEKVQGNRFFFADAAAQGARIALDPTGDLMERSSDYLNRVIVALNHIVQGYLNLEAKRRYRKGQPR